MDSSYFGNTNVENQRVSSYDRNTQILPSVSGYNKRYFDQPNMQALSQSMYPINKSEKKPTLSQQERMRAYDPKKGMDVMPQFQSMPTLFLIVIILYFVLAPILMLRQPAIDNSSDFLQTQMWMNCSLIVSFSVVYGILTLAFPNNFVSKYRNFLLPLLLICTMWFKSYFTYRNSLIPFCAVKNKDGTYNPETSPYNIGVLIWNTSKIPIAILVTYVVIVLFPQTVIPFNEFFCGEEIPHPLVEFFSIGFWIGCATWPSEASCYFEILRDGCQPVDNINFEAINQEIDTYNNEDTKSS